MLIPFGVVTPQSDIQRQNVFDFIGMHRLITNCCARSGETVLKRFAAFLRRTDKEIALGLFEIIHQPRFGFIDAIARHF